MHRGATIDPRKTLAQRVLESRQRQESEDAERREARAATTPTTEGRSLVDRLLGRTPEPDPPAPPSATRKHPWN